MNKEMTRRWLLLSALMVSTTVFAVDEAQQRKQGERWFASYDTDHDGFISREEYTTVELKKIEKRFTFIDRTKDGYISADEAIAAKKKIDKLRGVTEPSDEDNNDTAN
jgi:Ca2+-binding EF-hand superfamily protein